MLKFRLIFSAIFVFTFLSCGSGGGGGDSDSSNDNSDTPITFANDGSGLLTTCGVLVDRAIRTPVDSSRGEEVTVTGVHDSNLLAVQSGDEQLLVKLQSLGGTTGFNNSGAKDFLTNLAASEKVFLFDTGCTASVLNAQTAKVVHLVTATGRSFAEEIMKEHLGGVLETTGSCGESLFSTCYQALVDANLKHTEGIDFECESEVPEEVRYRPADDDCNGNASVVLLGDLADAFSIQLRYPDGTDRLVEECEEADCTPYKVQDYITTDSLKLGCFGAPGNSIALSDVHHLSIKLSANDHDPLRYCVPDPRERIN